jgi:hypothetical protein
MDDWGNWRLNLYMKVFFDIPIYRVTRSKYESEQRSFIQREMLADGDRNVQEMHRRNPSHKKFMENHFWEIYGGCWRFNEIIGFIRLHFFFTQIRGEYWRVTAKRITRTRKKVFALFDHKVTLEKKVPARSTNRKIYSLIQKYLTRAQNERHLRKFYVDKSVFENVGPYIDWNALMKLNNLRI